MPFDSNGVFSRVMNWTSDQQNGIAIECGRHDAEDDNFAQGFNNCFCRDGRVAATGDFNLGNYKLKNVAEGTATTDAVNKGQMDTALNAKANNNAVVHLIGNETISGYKILTGGVTLKSIANMQEGGTYINGNPSVVQRFGTIQFLDSANGLKGYVHNYQATNGDVVSTLVTTNGTSSGGISIGSKLNGSVYTQAPASDATNSVVTTTGISKSENGFVKLGNGIIIQWGRYDHGSNSAGFKATITLPTPFTNTNYSFSLVGTRQNDDDMTAAVNVEGRAKATTYINFQCSRVSGTSAGIRYIDWLAIGY